MSSARPYGGFAGAGSSQEAARLSTGHMPVESSGSAAACDITLCAGMDLKPEHTRRVRRHHLADLLVVVAEINAQPDAPAQSLECLAQEALVGGDDEGGHA